jgi:hypothetical protein
MSRCLFIVENTFTVPGHGLVLCPGIVPEGNERFRVGDRLSLKTPDGNERELQIDGIELLNPPPQNFAVTVMFKKLTKADVPIGTEVWSV